MLLVHLTPLGIFQSEGDEIKFKLKVYWKGSTKYDGEGSNLIGSGEPTSFQCESCTRLALMVRES